MHRDGLNASFKSKGSTRCRWEKKFGPAIANRLENERNAKHSRTLSKMIADGLLVPKSHGGKQGEFVSRDGRHVRYASSYELRRMQFLDSNSNVHSWTRSHGIFIEYEIDGKFRSYSPDFIVVTEEGTFVEEIKGWIRDERVHAAKVAAATKFCAQHSWTYRILFRDDLSII